ncbi:MAG: hypothetical protein ACI9KE_004097 [Polyangiales bacterium]|jgi:hypothetical protein
MFRFVCILCLVACSDGFVVGDEDAGPDASVDSGAGDAAGDAGRLPGDVGRPLGDAGTFDATSTDSGPVVDASSDAGGPFVDFACPAPWLYFADPARATIRRVSLTDGSECAALDGGGALDSEVTSVTIAGDVFVVASRGQLQGLDLQTDSVVWSIPQEADPESLDMRTVVVALREGFIAAWTRDEVLVRPLRVVDPLSGVGTVPNIDGFFYDLSAADGGLHFWGARSPGERSRRDLSGERIEQRSTVIGLKRIHALGARVVSTEGRASVLYVDDLVTPVDTAPERINPEGCSWIPFALASPMADDELIVGCTRVGGALGEVGSFRVVDSAGESSLLLLVDSVIWDAEIYAP